MGRVVWGKNGCYFNKKWKGGFTHTIHYPINKPLLFQKKMRGHTITNILTMAQSSSDMITITKKTQPKLSRFWKSHKTKVLLLRHSAPSCADFQILLANAVGDTRAIVVDVSNGGDDRGVGSGSILGDMGEWTKVLGQKSAKLHNTLGCHIWQPIATPLVHLKS